MNVHVVVFLNKSSWQLHKHDHVAVDTCTPTRLWSLNNITCMVANNLIKL